jgi:quinol monooxygenase YgiN
MLLIVGTVRFPADRMAEARPAMARMIAASRAEPGCIAYAYAEDVLEPGLIHIAEAWRDEESLAAHFKADHLASWRASCAMLGAHGRDLRVHETGDGKPV